MHTTSRAGDRPHCSTPPSPTRSAPAPFGHAHGICLHHALTGPTLAPRAYDILTARLALLRWEVDEVLRRQDWHTRYEPHGDEVTVTVRAPTHLDGRVYAGLPARDREHPPAYPAESPAT
ncbi:hypothetical protein [Streptomyces violaceoruber]|uniref:hypothetical protein n=1 Tax=Streptomyces violaceoruber TaxID=1935 RepID=UPI00403CB17C